MGMISNVSANLFRFTHVVYKNLHSQRTLLALLKEQEAINLSRNNLFPVSIIPLNYLQKEIIRTQKFLSNAGYELAETSAAELASLKISDCSFSGDEILVKIKLPIIKMGAKWQLFEIISIPFAWKEETCAIMQDVMYAAVDRDRLRVINGPALHDCRPYQDKLCFLPRMRADSINGPRCVVKMFKGATAEQLDEACTIRCQPSSGTIIGEVGFEKYILAHPPPQIEIECADRRFKLNSTLDGPGALEITVPCGCEAKISDDIHVPAIFPCQTLNNTEFSPTHLIPSIWTTLKTVMVDPRRPKSMPEFAHLDNFLNKDWTLKLPHLNLTRPDWSVEFTDATATPPDARGTTLGGVGLTWCILLSLGCIYLLYKIQHLEKHMVYLVKTENGTEMFTVRSGKSVGKVSTVETF
jgi:hypothetical protein